ncbi:MAG: Stp1/IreP family PP2C-type Ser/Thr phosphatase [Candidatus Riflebacteria bacterium]
MKISSFTHKGMVRQNNEDSCLVVPPWSGIALKSGACMFAVADGMGGQNAGEIASGLAVETARRWLESVKLNKISIEIVEELFAQINLEIWNYAQKNPEASGMGTTLTMVLIHQSTAICAHIGDSRLYRLRNNQFAQLTNDHTLVGEQVRMGKMTLEQARVHPTRHILSRVLGARQFVTPDIFSVELVPGDIFLLCSDGVYGMITDQQILDQLKQPEFSELAGSIIDAANAGGGKDNCTAVVLKIEELPIASPGRFSLTRLRNLISHWGEAGSV